MVKIFIEYLETLIHIHFRAKYQLSEQYLLQKTILDVSYVYICSTVKRKHL